MKLAEYNISELSIACIASHSVKRTELALQRAAKYFKCDLNFMAQLTWSRFVKVSNVLILSDKQLVSEPSQRRLHYVQ